MCVPADKEEDHGMALSGRAGAFVHKTQEESASSSLRQEEEGAPKLR